jgi:hypothetical protein
MAHDQDQAYAAGYLEGSLTRELISLHLINTVGDFCADTSKKPCSDLVNFLNKNFVWMSEQVKSFPNDPYWYHVNCPFLNSTENVYILNKLINLKGQSGFYTILRVVSWLP